MENAGEAEACARGKRAGRGRSLPRIPTTTVPSDTQASDFTHPLQFIIDTFLVYLYYPTHLVALQQRIDAVKQPCERTRIVMRGAWPADVVVPSAWWACNRKHGRRLGYRLMQITLTYSLSGPNGF
jgi:hypothetical protein